MLILGRREGDSIIIDGGIKIVIVSCDRGGVRIGIEAPSTVKILRGEIADQVAEENQRAAAAAVGVEWLTTLGVPQRATVSQPTAARAVASPPTATPTTGSDSAS